jgi:hypothetical protein
MNSIIQCLSIPELQQWFETNTKDSLLFKEFKDLEAQNSMKAFSCTYKGGTFLLINLPLKLQYNYKSSTQRRRTTN